MAEVTSGINRLIERIKRDGLAAGEAEQKRLAAEARAEADRLLAEARKEAQTTLAEARREAAELRRQGESELRLAVRDFLASFQKRIRSRIIRPIIDAELKSVLDDPEFLAQTLHTLIAARAGAEVEVAPDMQRRLGALFTEKTAGKLAELADVRLTSAPGLTGFRLRREGEGFVWDFTLEAIAAELASLVEPELKPFFDLDEAGAQPD